jgi:D-3-phosphoglycerate dehydrogenase
VARRPHARGCLHVSNKTVGIVGFGAIGQNVARMVKAFGCTVLYLKRTPLSAEEEAALGVQRATLAELLGRLRRRDPELPAHAGDRGLIDAAALRSMKPTAILVNVARGGVVVESDLVEALRARTIHGAAFDVSRPSPCRRTAPCSASTTSS